MTIDEKKRQLALKRLEQADESLDEARYLFDGNKSPRAIINRTYYAMFYAILALLIFEEYWPYLNRKLCSDESYWISSPS